MCRPRARYLRRGLREHRAVLVQEGEADAARDDVVGEEARAFDEHERAAAAVHLLGGGGLWLVAPQPRGRRHVRIVAPLAHGVGGGGRRERVVAQPCL